MTMEKELKSFDSIIQIIEQENEQIQKHVEEVIQKANEAKKYNQQLIWKIEAYQNLIQNEIYSDSFKGISQQPIDKVIQDRKQFENVIFSAKQFAKQQELIISGLQQSIKDVNNYEIITDYSIFKANTLNYIDYGYWSETFQYKAKPKNLEAIFRIMEGMTCKNADDVSILSFLFYFGILVEKDQERAKHLLENKLVMNNGRALHNKFYFNGKSQYDLLVKSAFLNNAKAFNSSGIVHSQMSKNQVSLLFCLAAAQFGNSTAMTNVAIDLGDGKGIQKDKKEACKYYLKSLQKGYFLVSVKKIVDEHYDECEEFRFQHPEYQKWDKSYDFFEQQEIILL